MRLPFHISKLFGLKRKTHGFALVNETGIRLVFRDADEIAQAPDEDAESQMITWDNLASMEITRGLVSDEVKLSVHVMFGEDPDGKNDSMIELELQKRDRPALDQFEKRVKEYRSGQRKDDVDEVLDDVRDLLDRM